MDIGLVDVDGGKSPNIDLMKISAWHKQQGDRVEWCLPIWHYDIVYQYKSLDNSLSPDIDWYPNADRVVMSGSGYNLDRELPEYMDHLYPDYSLYPKQTHNTAYGYLSRGCPKCCPYCSVSSKGGNESVKVANLSEFWKDQKNIKLFDPNILACPDRIDLLQQLASSGAYVDFVHGLDIDMIDEEIISLLDQIKIRCVCFSWNYPNKDPSEALRLFSDLYSKKEPAKKCVHILANHSSSFEEDIRRVYAVRSLGFTPHIDIYNKTHASKRLRELQRWVNTRSLFNSCSYFEEYVVNKEAGLYD